MDSKSNSRRSFLKQAMLLSAATALPTIITKASGRPAPSDKVNLACIGIGNQGGADVMSFANTGLANFVAFCDVDMGAPQTLEVLKKFPNVPRFQDFRKMFDKNGKSNRCSISRRSRSFTLPHCHDGSCSWEIMCMLKNQWLEHLMKLN